MLPSREPLRLVPCDEGSANMIEAELLLGEGGPELSASSDRVRLCLSPFWVVSSGFSAAEANGFSDAMKLVGRLGTHWRCGGAVATAIVLCGVDYGGRERESSGDRGVSCYVCM
jgi:hypothetical protein